MPEKKHTLLIGFVISIIIALVITIFSRYSGKQITSPETFGLKHIEQDTQTLNEGIEITKEYSDLENVFLQLIESYNTKNLDLLKQVDYRYAVKPDSVEGLNYVEAIKQYSDFQLHKVITKNMTVASINGYVIYSYKNQQNDKEKYVLSEFVVKSIGGELKITYLNTVNTNYEDIVKYLQ